jgi:hypothetical protein
MKQLLPRLLYLRFLVAQAVAPTYTSCCMFTKIWLLAENGIGVSN